MLNNVVWVPYRLCLVVMFSIDWYFALCRDPYVVMSGFVASSASPSKGALKQFVTFRKALFPEYLDWRFLHRPLVNHLWSNHWCKSNCLMLEQTGILQIERRNMWPLMKSHWWCTLQCVGCIIYFPISNHPQVLLQGFYHNTRPSK